MKTFLPFKRIFSLTSIFIAVIISNSSVNAQILPEMVFNSVSLEAGTAGADGARYRFNNITTGIDAVVEIKGRSSAAVQISSIDTSGPGLGYDKAFQPVIGIPGFAPANTTWSMDFNLSFYLTGTTTRLTISQFYVTGLDIDGDGASLSEWEKMYKISKIDSALVNSLTFTKIGTSAQGDDYFVEGIIANAPGIDTSAKSVIATYRYENKDGIDFTIGAKTYATGTSAGMRLNSLWFRDFFNPILPVKMTSFTATLNTDNKAHLKWATATEENANHFVIQKSFDGKNFSDAGIVFANGNSEKEMQYSFSDDITKYATSVIYYRIATVDNDSHAEYSTVRIIRTNKETEKNIIIATYPNPVTSDLRITIPSGWQNKKVLYEVIGSNGLIAKKTETVSSSQTETLAIADLNAGFYIVKAVCNGQIAQQKIIKQ